MIGNWYRDVVIVTVGVCVTVLSLMVAVAVWSFDGRLDALEAVAHSPEPGKE